MEDVFEYSENSPGRHCADREVLRKPLSAADVGWKISAQRRNGVKRVLHRTRLQSKAVGCAPAFDNILCLAGSDISNCSCRKKINFIALGSLNQFQPERNWKVGNDLKRKGFIQINFFLACSNFTSKIFMNFKCSNFNYDKYIQN